MKIGFVGAGNMGQAILKGLINSGISQNDLVAITKTVESSQKIASDFKVKAVTKLKILKIVMWSLLGSNLKI